MPGIQIADAKAPWVVFETRAEEDRDASIQQGRFVARDVDYAIITPHGSKDRVERVVKEWFDHLDREAAQGRFESNWLTAYKRAYVSWKEGREIPTEGTPIINWPLLSPSQVRMLQDLHILTVEVLANANEELIRRLGMGGRNLVQKAKDYLAQATPGKAAEETAALRSQVESQGHTIKDLQEKLDTLKATQNAAKMPGALSSTAAFEGLDGGVPGIGASDLLDLTTPTAPARKKL